MISASQTVSQNFSLLPYREGGRAPSSNMARKQAADRAIFRVLRIACTVSKIYRGCIPPRTLNSSHQVALYSGSQQDFTEVSYLTPSLIYVNFSAGSPKIHRARRGGSQPRTGAVHSNSSGRPQKHPSSTKLGMWPQHRQGQLPNTVREFSRFLAGVKLCQKARVDSFFTHFFDFQRNLKVQDDILQTPNPDTPGRELSQLSPEVGRLKIRRFGGILRLLTRLDFL